MPIAILLIFLFLSLTMNVFLFVLLKKNKKKLNDFQMLRDVIEKHKKENPPLKGIITVTMTDSVLGGLTSFKYDYKIEIVELERYENGKSKINAVRILHHTKGRELADFETKRILDYWKEKYVETKDIDFLEKVEKGEPIYSEENPNLIEKIRDEK